MGDFRGGRRQFDRAPRKMFKVKCSECGKEAEVPFKPELDEDGNPVRPVYCRECFQKRRQF